MKRLILKALALLIVFIFIGMSFLVANSHDYNSDEAGSIKDKNITSLLNLIPSKSRIFYKERFTESQLPPGSTWYVNLSNGIDSGAITGRSYTLSLTNGTYYNTIATSDKTYSPSPSGGSFNVNGTSLSKYILFTNAVRETYKPSAEYPIKINSSPSGSGYFQQMITLNLSKYGINPIGSNFEIAFLNSSLAYSWIQSINSTSLTVWSKIPYNTSGLILEIYPSSDNLLSATGYLGEAPQLSPVYGEYFNAPYVFNFATDFAGTTLPSGIGIILKTNGTYSVNNGITIKTGSGSPADMAFSTPSFNQPVGIISYLSSFNNSGTFPNIGISNVSNYGDGYGLNLPSLGTGASGTFTPNSNNSVHMSIGVRGLFWTPANTIYYYNNSKFTQVNPPDGYNQAIPSHYMPSFGIWYTETNLTAVFNYILVPTAVSKMPTTTIGIGKAVYSVNFTESGLPSGSKWYVNGSILLGHASAPSDISFSLPNGTYTFTATNLSGYYTTTSSFNITIMGNNVNETVDYYHWAYITGIMSPGNTLLTINGKAVLISFSGAFNVSVTNGTYHVVASLPGYITYYSNFTLNSGNAKKLTITLNPLSKPFTISTADMYAIFVSVVEILGIAGIVIYIRRK